MHTGDRGRDAAHVVCRAARAHMERGGHSRASSGPAQPTRVIARTTIDINSHRNFIAICVPATLYQHWTWERDASLSNDSESNYPVGRDHAHYAPVCVPRRAYARE